MHGRYDFHFTDAERTQLRQYLERGGTLLADSICASKPFAAAFRREVAAALPGHTLARIPPDDPLFTTAYGGFDIRSVSLRDPQAAADGKQPRRRPRSPGRAATRRHPTRRPLGRHLFALRHQLRPRKPRSHRLPRLHPTRRRPHRPERAAVFVESVGTTELHLSSLADAKASQRADNRSAVDLPLIVDFEVYEQLPRAFDRQGRMHCAVTATQSCCSNGDATTPGFKQPQSMHQPIGSI